MKRRTSLKKKSIIALLSYVCLFTAIIGLVVYLIIDPPLRIELKKKLDIRADLLMARIMEPLNNATVTLRSIIHVAESDIVSEKREKLIASLFSQFGHSVVSGGIWPIPEVVDGKKQFNSVFFNRASDGRVDRIEMWNNPQGGGYERELWYLDAIELYRGDVAWSEVYVDPYTRVKMITLSSPYYINKHLAGVATVDLSLQNLLAVISKNADRYDLGVVLRDKSNEKIISHHFIVRQGMYTTKQNFGDFNWSIEVVNATRLVNDDIYEIVASIELWLIPILLIGVMLAYILIDQYVIKPLVMISDRVKQSPHGGIIDFPYHHNDEIGYLIDAFNQKTIYLEAEKLKAQASTQAKSSFLATLSHEIRTPMNGVLGTAQILLKSPLSAQQQQQLKVLYDSGLHMMELLNEILDFSKIEQGTLELDNDVFEFASLIESVISVYRHLCEEKGLRFNVAYSIPEHQCFFSDVSRIKQILFNLLNNALKFTSHGTISVSFSEMESDDKKHFMCIKVSDTGIGIAQEVRDEIFKPFIQAESSTTRRFGGTGLGLAIVDNICRSMGGSISLESEVGYGSSFEVMIRVERAHTSQLERNHKTHEYNYTGLKALVVEDNRTNIMILETFLNNQGFVCSKALDGEQALQAMTAEHFDLVVMDNHMPVMDGIECMKRIRGLPDDRSKVFILGCSADVYRKSRDEMLQAGANDVIAKPVSEAILQDKLNKNAEKLYQYQTYSEDNQIHCDVDTFLLNFCLAIENREFEQARKYLQIIKESVCGGLVPSELKSLCDEFDHLLVNEVKPSQSGLDRFTVLLSNFCNSELS